MVTCGPATSQYGATALILAAAGGHTYSVELLLDRGADLAAKDIVSAAAVCVAVRRVALSGAAMATKRRGVVLLARAGM